MKAIFEIKTIIELMTAERMLSDHKAELLTQTTEKAIGWQIYIIKKLKRTIKKAVL